MSDLVFSGGRLHGAWTGLQASAAGPHLPLVQKGVHAKSPPRDLVHTGLLYRPQ